MAESVTNELIYEVLKRVQNDVSDLKAGQQRLETDVRIVKGHIGELIASEARQDGDLAELRLRMERIERRLELRS